MAPKFVPVIVTEVPTGPSAGETVVMTGAVMTVNKTPSLAALLTVTTTLPVVARDGTGTVIAVEPQLVGIAVTPLKVTVLDPWLDPKFTPVIVTAVSTVPVSGERLVMPGVEPTMNGTPLLATPPTVTTTFPVVAPLGTGATMLLAPQVVGVAAVPLNVTVLEP